VKIGITGGNGFIGSHVVDHLLELGHTPVVFDRRSVQQPWRPGVEYFLGDVTAPVAVTELAAHVDGIIHLAACLGTQETIKNPRPSATTNVLGGLNVLEAGVEHGLPEVYIGVGNWWMENSYSISKHTVERYIRMYNKERGGKINIVRAVNAYGPRQSVAPPFGPAKVRKITPAFVCRALTGMPIEIYGDGEQISDMVHVRDVARALVAALITARDGTVLGEAVSVGPYESLTVNQVAEIVQWHVADLGGPLQRPIKHLPMRPGEIPGDRVSADPDTLKLIGINPASLTSFNVGIRETIVWFAENWLPGFSQFDDKTESDDTVVSAGV
jgi:nucleoside-diphosphate-sugar epimerase